MVFSSPGLVFPIEDFRSREEQLSHAAKLIYGALEFKESIDNGTIRPDRMGKLQLDMSQYKKIFGTTRIPREGRDELVYHPQSRHIVVAYKNYFYKVQVYTEDGELLQPIELLRQLQLVVEATSGLNGIPIGLLTSEHRDTWAKTYEMLKKDKVNQASLKAIEGSLFLVSIDRTNRPPKCSVKSVEGVEDLARTEKQTVASLQMVHGNRTNSGNRWYDKTIQLIVGSEGESGITYEHSPSEGPPIASLMDSILNNLKKYDLLLRNSKGEKSVSLPEKLQFNVSEKLSTSISTANENLGK